MYKRFLKIKACLVVSTIYIAWAALPVVASSEGGGPSSSHFSLLNELSRFANFFVVVGVLYYFLSKALRTFFSERRENIVTLIKDAEESKSDADKKLKKIEDKFKGIDLEISKIEESAKKEADKIYDEIIRSARKEVEKILKKAELDIDMERKKAIFSLKRDVSEAAFGIAESILKKELTSTEHSKLINNYVETLELSQ